jgi:hypothetical protein
MIDSDKIRTYRMLRNAGRDFHGKLFTVIPKSVLVSAAEDFGLWKKNTLVADMGDTDILADRMIYDKRWEGKNCREHFETTVADAALSEHERRYFEAMKTASFSLFSVCSTAPGSHIVLSDRLMALRTGLTPPDIELIDMGLSETALPGTLLATRALDVGGFYMTSGVSFPFSGEHEPTIVKYLRVKPSGFGKKRLDQPDRYAVYFRRLHRQIGIEIRHEAQPNL